MNVFTINQNDVDVFSRNRQSANACSATRFPYDAEMACYAILWVKHVASEIVKTRLVEDLLARNDVEDARYTTSGPLCLVVKYNGLMTGPSRLQAFINRPGIRAMIVGC